mmetsp:Transcript_31173/g.69324  ORF Transcript_31173/g.69324 Transcript_31173/m.69324 type:complete len:349 (+) Transcript_31173:2440-3486(+)
MSLLGEAASSSCSMAEDEPTALAAAAAACCSTVDSVRHTTPASPAAITYVMPCPAAADAPLPGLTCAWEGWRSGRGAAGRGGRFSRPRSTDPTFVPTHTMAGCRGCTDTQYTLGCRFWPLGMSPCRLHTSRTLPVTGCRLSSTPTSVPTRMLCVLALTKPRGDTVMHVVCALGSSLILLVSFRVTGSHDIRRLSMPAVTSCLLPCSAASCTQASTRPTTSLSCALTSALQCMSPPTELREKGSQEARLPYEWPTTTCSQWQPLTARVEMHWMELLCVDTRRITSLLLPSSISRTIPSEQPNASTGVCITHDPLLGSAWPPRNRKLTQVADLPSRDTLGSSETFLLSRS